MENPRHRKAKGWASGIMSEISMRAQTSNSSKLFPITLPGWNFPSPNICVLWG